MKKLSIVVPCYNEQETIYPFLEETQKIETKMMFKKPFESDATSDVVLTKEGNTTKVVWNMDCELDYPMNLMKLMMDYQMEDSYGKGLKKLKELSEK